MGDKRLGTHLLEGLKRIIAQRVKEVEVAPTVLDELKNAFRPTRLRDTHVLPTHSTKKFKDPWSTYFLYYLRIHSYDEQ